MLRLVAPALAVLALSAGCRTSLDEDDDGSSDDTDGDAGIDAPISAACMEATTYQNLANIEAKIFKQSCIFSGCHNGANTDAGRIDMREGKSFTELVGVDSEVASGRKIVVAGDPAASYLMLILGHIPPDQASPPGEDPPPSIGFMPQGTGGVLLCEQKRDAIERWIMAGAMND